MKYLISSNGFIFGCVFKSVFPFKEDYLDFFGYHCDDNYRVLDDDDNYYCDLKDVELVSQSYYQQKFC